MIDLDKLREENKRRLLGLDVDENEKVPRTRSDFLDAEVCWEAISYMCRKKVVEKTRKDGKTYKAASKELAYPELTTVTTVGSRKTKTDKAKKDLIERSNIDTMEEMYQMRNAMNAHYQDDVNDKYVGFFKSVVEVIDQYAVTVCADIIAQDPDFIAKLNIARGCKPENAE